MNELELRDSCRANFNKYTRKAFSLIPKIDRPNILDLGCGTGISAILFAELTDGIITSIDIDKKSLDWYREKIERGGLTERIKIINDSILNVKLAERYYSIILAEGILHIIGFEKGFDRFTRNLKDNGYFLIHDEIGDMRSKQQLFEKYRYELIESFILDEKVWWDEYCGCLERKIKEFERYRAGNKDLDNMFQRERSEIEMYRRDPEEFRSIIYLLKKTR